MKEIDVNKGLNNNHMKTKNRGTVLRMIANRPISRTDIAARMGLSKMAITKIVGELLEEGYLAEKEIDSDGAVGRTPLLLDISPLAPLAVGVYISRNELCSLVCDLHLHTLFESSLPLENETAETLESKLFSLCDASFAFCRQNRPRNKVIGIGVSAISPLDPVGGRILNPTNFYGIVNFPVTDMLGGRYRCPAILDNDMNASALAENLYGIGERFDTFLYLGITNGIGAGAVLNGQLFSNNSISVGEIGHTSINFDGPLCSCGNRGCLELYADMPVVLRRLEKETGKARLSPADLPALYGDARCAAVLRDMTDKLAVALINAVNLLDLQCITIGHEGSFLPDGELAYLEKRIDRGILASQYKTVKVLRSTFSDRAPKVGSTCLALQRLFSGETIEKPVRAK